MHESRQFDHSVVGEGTILSCRTDFFLPYLLCDRYRAAELKHGRVCMLASVGYIVQGLYHLPDGPFEATKPIDALIKVRPSPHFCCVYCPPVSYTFI